MIGAAAGMDHLVETEVPGLGRVVVVEVVIAEEVAAIDGLAVAVADGLADLDDRMVAVIATATGPDQVAAAKGCFGAGGVLLEIHGCDVVETILAADAVAVGVAAVDVNVVGAAVDGRLLEAEEAVFAAAGPGFVAEVDTSGSPPRACRR